MVLAVLMASAGLSEITQQKEAHEVRVNTWNQAIAFMLRQNSNYLYLQSHAYFDVLAMKVAICALLIFANFGI